MDLPDTLFGPVVFRGRFARQRIDAHDNDIRLSTLELGEIQAISRAISILRALTSNQSLIQEDAGSLQSVWEIGTSRPSMARSLHRRDQSSPSAIVSNIESAIAVLRRSLTRTLQDAVRMR
jgi:hypothetical protein